MRTYGDEDLEEDEDLFHQIKNIKGVKNTETRFRKFHGLCQDPRAGRYLLKDIVLKFISDSQISGS
jgi:hypothetical protein